MENRNTNFETSTTTQTDANTVLADSFSPITTISKCDKCGDITDCYTYTECNFLTKYIKVIKYICRWCEFARKMREKNFR